MLDLNVGSLPSTTDTPPAHLRDLVAAHLVDRGQSPALLGAQSSRLSYAQLLAQIDRVGSALRAAGVGANDRVAILLPNSQEMAVAFLGVACYATAAPLNPAYGVGELGYYLSDLAATAVVTTAAADQPIHQAARQLGIPVVDHKVWFEPANIHDAVTVPSRSEDVGLVLHTSGTTSRPKQVPLTHQNLCASAAHIAATLQLTPADRCLNVMPLFHIHGLVGVLLSSLHAGGSVVCTPGFQEAAFEDWLTTFEPTWYSAVPTIHQAVLATVKSSPDRSVGRRLRLIRSSSSALPPTVMLDLEKTFGVPVIESYGMTEAAHQMASNPLPPAVRKPGSVGLPAGPEMAVMDEHGTLLPAGATGEIVIRGPNVTTGYVNNPEANSAAFIDGWFRTGDLGRFDEQGYFHLTGRKKEMINRGGENISPREIDEALLEHPAVAQAVTFAVPHESLGEDVAAAVVLHRNSAASEAELRAFAFGRLSDFKVPSRILLVDAIPTGPTGKLQRIGLHEQLAPQLHAAYLAPEGELEQRLASLWSDVLGRSQIGRCDNFFLCGGDSLSAARLAARMRAVWAVELHLPVLFQQPTLAAQAVLIQDLQRASQQARTVQTEALLQEIEQLSDDEAIRLLGEEQQNDGR